MRQTRLKVSRNCKSVAGRPCPPKPSSALCSIPSRTFTHAGVGESLSEDPQYWPSTLPNRLKSMVVGPQEDPTVLQPIGSHRFRNLNQSWSPAYRAAFGAHEGTGGFTVPWPLRITEQSSSRHRSVSGVALGCPPLQASRQADGLALLLPRDPPWLKNDEIFGGVPGPQVFSRFVLENRHRHHTGRDECRDQRFVRAHPSLVDGSTLTLVTLGTQINRLRGRPLQH